MKFIKPARADLKVPKLDGGTLDPEGEMLEITRYWRRLARDGDVIISAKAPRKPKSEDK